MEIITSHSPNKNSGREFILWKAYELFLQKGYHSTTMADLGEASGLLKGSMYHYFTSKEDLMKQVLEKAHLTFKEQVFSIAFHTERPPKESLQVMLEKMEQYFFQGAGGCLMGNIGLETAATPTSFTIVIHSFFEEWIEVFTHLFKSTYEENQARQLAKQSLADMQGALMLSCIFRDKTYFTNCCSKILTLIT